MDVNSVLKGLKGHKVCLNFTLPEEMRMRQTSGILEGFNESVIHIKSWNSYGEEAIEYLNRRACTLLSVIDEGKSE